MSIIELFKKSSRSLLYRDICLLSDLYRSLFRVLCNRVLHIGRPISGGPRVNS